MFVALGSQKSFGWSLRRTLVYLHNFSAYRHKSLVAMSLVMPAMRCKPFVGWSGIVIQEREKFSLSLASSLIPRGSLSFVCFLENPFRRIVRPIMIRQRPGRPVVAIANHNDFKILV